ncbi:Imm1 family immunity protein [Actinokineospora sp. G85]|uniref:Imm1 family immunity protein n=1 Tax=Actinokineospora sp. G85 TaxID=3406626 RepID=UPI003C77DFC4
MVELEVWYNQIPKNKFHPGEPTIKVRTAAELDALIDRIRAETRDHRCPASIQMKVLANERDPVLEVGLGQDKGYIHYLADDFGRTVGDGDPDATVEYVYMSNLGEVPADSEVSIDVVRQGLHEFLATGTRPSVVREGAMPRW